MIQFNFYGIYVHLYSDDQSIIDLSIKDFYSFLDEKPNTPDLTIRYKKELPDREIIDQKFSHRTSVSRFSQKDSIRTINFGNEALTYFDFKKETCEIISLNPIRVHEIVYLLILSRVGKRLDLDGLHRLHACGVNYKNNAIILTMPSGGGKSTTLLHFLKDQSNSLIADDIVLIDTKGQIHPFPNRLSTSDIVKIPVKDPENNRYWLSRKLYGTKFLTSLRGVANSISTNYDKSYYFIGKRKQRRKNQIKEPKLEKINKLQAFLHSIPPLIIGFGTPQVVEYFLELTVKDFFRLTKILFSRIKATIFFVLKSDCYKIHLSDDLEKNEALIKSVLKPN